jgi:hypothetical protein
MAENTNECVIEWIPGRDYVGLTQEWKCLEEQMRGIRKGISRRCENYCQK